MHCPSILLRQYALLFQVLYLLWRGFSPCFLTRMRASPFCHQTGLHIFPARELNIHLYIFPVIHKPSVAFPRSCIFSEEYGDTSLLMLYPIDAPSFLQVFFRIRQDVLLFLHRKAYPAYSLCPFPGIYEVFAL